MTLAKYNYPNSYHVIIDNTEVLWDWPNQRVRILGNQQPFSNTLRLIKKLAVKSDMGKIITCALPSYKEIFLGQGFEVEGKIKGFFAGRDALCYSYFVSPARRASEYEYNGILPVDSDWDRDCRDEQPGLSYLTRKATPADITGMISLFRSVFSTYPSPVFDEGYLRANMEYDRVTYRVAVDSNNRIVGIASAEKDPVNLNAEITDCVTNPQFRGQGVLGKIISELEEDLYLQGFICLYTLCRAAHAPINKAFFRLGYLYSGRLIKNCNICGSFEDMNVLVKVLR